MRILILGGDGMLGHQLLKHFSHQHEVAVTLRQRLSAYKDFGLFQKENAFTEIDIRFKEDVLRALEKFRPNAVINAIGIVKQRPSGKEIIPSLEINALFPHKLALLCKAMNIRMIHMSTDCVFSGNKGNYRESDKADADDIYGRTKYLGEVHENHCLTLRTSIIGRELDREQGLLEWFLKQEGSVKGFKNAIFSGFTTKELSRIIENILLSHPKKGGLYHVSSAPISKLDLLMLIREKLNLDVEIVPSENPRLNRSLDSRKFYEEFNYKPPTWDKMIEDLKMN